MKPGQGLIKRCSFSLQPRAAAVTKWRWTCHDFSTAAGEGAPVPRQAGHCDCAIRCRVTDPPWHIPALGTQRVTQSTGSSQQGKLTPSSVHAKSAAGHQVRPCGQGWCQPSPEAPLTCPRPGSWLRKYCRVYRQLCWSQQGLEDEKGISNTLRTSLKDCHAAVTLAPHQITANSHYTPQTRQVKHIFSKVLLLHSASKNSPQRQLSCSELAWLRASRNWHFMNSLNSGLCVSSSKLAQKPGWSQIFSTVHELMNIRTQHTWWGWGNTGMVHIYINVWFKGLKSTRSLQFYVKTWCNRIQCWQTLPNLDLFSLCYATNLDIFLYSRKTHPLIKLLFHWLINDSGQICICDSFGFI